MSRLIETREALLRYWASSKTPITEHHTYVQTGRIIDLYMVSLLDGESLNFKSAMISRLNNRSIVFNTTTFSTIFYRRLLFIVYFECTILSSYSQAKSEFLKQVVAISR